MNQQRYNKYLLKQKSMIGGIFKLEDVSSDDLSVRDVKRGPQPVASSLPLSYKNAKMNEEFNIDLDFKEIIADISNQSQLVGNFYETRKASAEIGDILTSVEQITSRMSEAVEALQFIRSDTINKCIIESVKHGAKFKYMLADEEKHKQVLQHIRDITGNGFNDLVEHSNLDFVQMLTDVDNADIHITPSMISEYVKTNKKLLADNARPLAIADVVHRGGFDPDSRSSDCDIYSVVGRLFTNENSLESALIECDSKMSALIITTVNTVAMFIKRSTFGISEIIANSVKQMYTGELNSARDVANFIAKITFVFCKVFLIKLFISMIIHNSFIPLPSVLVESILDKYFVGAIVSKIGTGVVESGLKFVYDQIRNFLNERFTSRTVTTTTDAEGATARVAEQYADVVHIPVPVPDVDPGVTVPTDVPTPAEPSAFGEFMTDATGIIGGLLEIPLLIEFLKTSINIFKSKKGLGVLDPLISDPKGFYEYYKIPAYKKASGWLRFTDPAFLYLGADQVFLKYMYASYENISNKKLLGAIKFAKLENMCSFFTSKEMALIFEKYKSDRSDAAGVGSAIVESYRYDSRILMNYVKLIHEEIRERLAKEHDIDVDSVYKHDDYVKHKNELLCWRAHIDGVYTENTKFCDK